MLAEIVTAVQAVASLVQFGMTAREAWAQKGLGMSEVSALGALFGGAEGLLKLKAASPKDQELGALHLAMVARCFGHAVKEHQAYQEQMAADSQPLFQGAAPPPRQPQQLEGQLGRLLRKAAEGRIEPGSMSPGKAEVELVDALAGRPLDTPYYRFLWEALVTPEGGEPPLLQVEPGSRSRFENSFLLALGKAMASPDGERLQEYLEGLKRDYKPQLLEQLLINDMADWGSRHTFGNFRREERPEGDPLPFMPLERMYVEPLARDARRREDTAQPVLGRLEELLKSHQIVIVQADFGMGKSLTSRMLTHRLARQFRENVQRRSSELVLPVYVRCADDLLPTELLLENIVRRARGRHARTLEFSMKPGDPALRPPAETQRALFVIDGLDEVHLGEKGLAELFGNLKQEATHAHRFVIFSRPGALPSVEAHVLKGIPILQLLPWNDQQVESWLECWRGVNHGVGPNRQELESQGLGELAATPILLLMVAHTWAPGAAGVRVSRADLYERFFQSIARGKYKADQDRHPTVAEAEPAPISWTHPMSRRRGRMCP